MTAAAKIAQPDPDVAEYFTDPDRPGFLAWGLEVNAKVEKAVSLSILDLPDAPYSDYYEDGLSPGEAARAALAEADF